MLLFLNSLHSIFTSSMSRHCEFTDAGGTTQGLNCSTSHDYNIS